MNTIEVKKITVTPELATAWLDRNTDNRKVRGHHVDLLSNKMTSGDWMLTHQGVAFSKSGVLLDGQHRLLAIEKSKKTVELFVFFGIDDDAFKAIDSGIKRSISDLTNLDKETAEISAKICGIVYSSRQLTPENVIKISNSELMAAHSILIEHCNTKVKYYSSGGFRLGACLAVVEGSPITYVSEIFRNLILMHIEKLPKIAHSLIKQVNLGQVSVTNQKDCITRAFKVCMEKNNNLSRLIVNDFETDEIYNKIKKHILKG